MARCVIRRYETLKALLIEVFGVEPEDAENDACLMEHAVSPATMNRMAALLERLRSGESIDLHHLRGHHAAARSGCADCEAAGACRASAATEPAHGVSQ